MEQKIDPSSASVVGEGFFPLTEYRKHLLRFVADVTVPEMRYFSSDSLFSYIAETMCDEEVKTAIRRSKVAKRVFLDTMMLFVKTNLLKADYRRKRLDSEVSQWREASLWSHEKRAAAYSVIVNHLSDKYAAIGFDRSRFDHTTPYYDAIVSEADWHVLLDEWLQLMNLFLRLEAEKFIRENRELHDRLLRHNLSAAQEYVSSHQISLTDFNRVWAVMGGRWNTLEFGRIYKELRWMTRYPVLGQITDRIGRTPSPDGNEGMPVSFQGEYRLEHASGSDIHGIGIGSDIGAMLPFEWAQYFDADTENVFLQKLVTGRLQTFEHQSRILSPTRSLTRKPSRPKGPVVVCVDTSGSMMGEPWSVALSLMMALTEMCERERRDCYLIAFSVLARPVNVMTDRAELLRFFSHRPQGDTDARRMMDALFALLRDNARYAGADVLWITDFRIPVPSKNILAEMEKARARSVRFYGLKLGMAENKWLPYFDEMYTIEEVHMAVR